MSIPDRFRTDYDPEPDEELEDARRDARLEPRVSEHEHRRQDWIGELFEDEWRYGR